MLKIIFGVIFIMEQENIKLKKEVKYLKYEVAYYEVIMSSCPCYSSDHVNKDLVDEYIIDKDDKELKEYLYDIFSVDDPRGMSSRQYLKLLSNNNPNTTK
jgi:hypothetical protein